MRKKKSYHERVSAMVVKTPADSAAIAISELYQKTEFSDGGENNIKGIDPQTASNEIAEQEKLLANGDLVSLEKMLLSQTHVLNSMFNQMIMRVSNCEYLEQIDVFIRIALKAQNQSRQSASTLAEIKGIKKTTFVHQLNQGVNQQVNNGPQENLTEQSNERTNHDVDGRSERGSQKVNKADKTLRISENAGGEETLSHELLQARNEKQVIPGDAEANSPDEPVRKRSKAAG